MSLREQMRQAIIDAEKAGCGATTELAQARGVVRMEAPDDALDYALGRLKRITELKERRDESVRWFEQQKSATRESGIDSPEIDRIFKRYDGTVEMLGDNWGALSPSLEELTKELQQALAAYREISEALATLNERLKPWAGNRRFDYMEFRKKRLEAQHHHGYQVALAEIEDLVAKVDAEEQLIAEEEAAAATPESINSYLESQITRFEETMSVADYKKLTTLTERIDDPSSRMALWNLLREYETKHATKVKMVKVKKPKKPKLSPEAARDGWEVLTLAAGAEEPEDRKAILEQFRNALRKKQGKRARDGVASSLKLARELSEVED